MRYVLNIPMHIARYEISTSIKGRLGSKTAARCERSINGSVAAVLVKTKSDFAITAIISKSHRVAVEFPGTDSPILPPVGESDSELKSGQPL